MTEVADAAWMARAIRLAERGLWSTSPNPRVGCLLVRGGEIVGAGWHERAGGPHAEVNALRQAGERASGATAYVSLEPCNHHGRTGPCSEALLAAGVQRVVYGAGDPGTAAGGARRLQDAGVAVTAGVLAAEARRLNPGFHQRLATGRPLVRLKLAQSLDGRTALDDGRSQWITGVAARQDGQRWRARSCAMITGIGTVLDDDPQLTARLPGVQRQPLRVVMDSRLRTPAKASIRAQGNVLFCHAQDRADDGQHLRLPLTSAGLDLSALLDELGKRGLNEVLVEAGARLNGAFLAAGLVDELIIYQAPVLLGPGRPSATLAPLLSLDDKLGFVPTDIRRVGDDWRIIARPVGS